MMAERERRQRAVLDFIREFYKRNRKPPSVRVVEHELKDSGVNRDNFYDLFENMEDACRQAGVPATDLGGKTRAALEGRREEQEQHERETKDPQLVVTLTPAQKLRLAGMSHFEHGKDIHEIVDALLEYDSTIRNLGLDFDKIQRVNQFLELAKERKWQLLASPNILEALTQLYNLGFLRLDASTAAGLITISNQLRDRNWDPVEFVDYVSRNKEMVDAYVRYMKGEIPITAVREVINKYVFQKG